MVCDRPLGNIQCLIKLNFRAMKFDVTSKIIQFWLLNIQVQFNGMSIPNSIKKELMISGPEENDY